MSNQHHHANPRYRNSHHQYHNPASYNSDRRPPHPNHLDSYPGRSDHHLSFRPADQDLSYANSSYHRRRDYPRSRRDSAGYGGTPSSDVPERGTPVGPIDRDLPHLGRNFDMPPPPPQHPSDNYHNELPRSGPFHSKPSLRNNIYKGGCPYNYPVRTAERNQSNRNADNQPQRSLPGHEDAREAASLRNRGTASTSGPVKSKYNSRPPVKPVNNLQASDSLYNGFCSAFQYDKDPSLREKRYARSLSCEKMARPQNTLSSRSSALSCGSAALGYPAIAHPTGNETEDAQLLTQNQTERENGASQSNEGSAETPEKTEQNNREDSGRANDHQTQKRDSAPKIFGKNLVRVPKLPDDNISEWSTSGKCQEDTHISAQLKQEVKEVVTSSDAVKAQLKLSLLRSVPAPVRRSTVDDTPQTRAAAAALHRAGQADCEEVKLVKKGQPSRTASSHEAAAPSRSERQQVTDDAEKEDKTTRQFLATSISEPGSKDQRKGSPNMKREMKLEVGNRENQHMSHLKQSAQNSVEREGQEFKRTKRRGTDLGESNRSTAKRPRPVASAEAVNVEDQAPLRRSQRFQQPKPKKDWEITKFEPERVQNLFQAQLRAQPMLLRISFLGISDGDLRSTLDIFKNGRKLPEPDYRSLEVNNNRIRCITNEICASISALRVSSLNVSCNMLTTLGDKLGQCHKLKFLNLSRNRLSCLPQELCDLTNLEVLDLSGNIITRLPSGLCRLKKLEILSLARNKLEVLPEDIAGEGAALTGLNISQNHGFRFFPRCTEHWKKLMVLHMSDTEMYRSLSRREHRLRPAALLKELAGRNQDMLVARRAALRSHGEITRRQSW